jgi:hypothetical protein
VANDPHPFHLNAIKFAVFSDDRAHRYWLVRRWDTRRPVLVACMFNPSTADERKDDQTILRLIAFAKRWGYGGILVVNLHSIRSPDPSVVRAMKPGTTWGDAQPEAIGTALSIACDQGTPVLAAWGALASKDDVAPFLAASHGVDLICLGLTADGSPKHPMARGRARVPDDQEPLPYRRAA